MTIAIRALAESDIEVAERVRRSAFGTLFGLPDPMSFRGDAALLAGRRWAFPDGGLIAEDSGADPRRRYGQSLGQSRRLRTGRGPSAHWRKAIARQLLDAAMPIFDRWGSRVIGLFTFPERPTHIRLYQSFGFWPRALTAIMVRPVNSPSKLPEALSLSERATERSKPHRAMCRADRRDF